MYQHMCGAVVSGEEGLAYSKDGNAGGPILQGHIKSAHNHSLYDIHSNADMGGKDLDGGQVGTIRKLLSDKTQGEAMLNLINGKIDNDTEKVLARIGTIKAEIEDYLFIIHNP